MSVASVLDAGAAADDSLDVMALAMNARAELQSVTHLSSTAGARDAASKVAENARKMEEMMQQAMEEQEREVAEGRRLVLSCLVLSINLIHFGT